MQSKLAKEPGRKVQDGVIWDEIIRAMDGLGSGSGFIVGFDDDAEVRDVRVGEIHDHWLIGESGIQPVAVRDTKQVNLASGSSLPEPPNAPAFPRCS